MILLLQSLVFFFFNDTATTEIYTLSLHDALPISPGERPGPRPARDVPAGQLPARRPAGRGVRARDVAEADRPCRLAPGRSEEHTSELQSRQYLVCRLLLEKKKKKSHPPPIPVLHL